MYGHPTHTNACKLVGRHQSSTYTRTFEGTKYEPRNKRQKNMTTRRDGQYEYGVPMKLQSRLKRKQSVGLGTYWTAAAGYYFYLGRAKHVLTIPLPTHYAEGIGAA